MVFCEDDSMTKELKQEYTRRITQANKTQLITILYEMLLIYVEDAKNAYSRKDRMEFRESVRKARGCVDELLSSLHFEYEISMNFLQLYLYVNRELARADVRHQTESLTNVEKVIRELHKAYLELEKQDHTGAVMQNVQSVYAGLTYGKHDLNENLADQGFDRGFRV